MTTIVVARNEKEAKSQSAFVRGFIDDPASARSLSSRRTSQSAFVRGFIDDKKFSDLRDSLGLVSIRVRARLHR